MSPRPWRGAVVLVLSVVALLAVGSAVTGLWDELWGDGSAPVGTRAEIIPWDEALSVPSFAPPPSPSPSPEPAFDLGLHSTTDPASPWVIVNKQHPVADGYAPGDLVEVVPGVRLRAVVQADLAAMVDAGAAAGVQLVVRSGYRSFAEQTAARADVEARRGFAHAERYSARPGFSEHQTGLAVDIDSGSQPRCNLQTCFARTPEGLWLAEHAWEHGFVVRYTEQNTAVTGYAPEGWHLRWVGRELTAELRSSGTGSLEEAFDVPGGPEYVAR